MVSPKLLVALAALGMAAPGYSALAATRPTRNTPAAPAAGHSLYESRELWATVDVCNPKDKPDTVGVRGSMPSDGHAGDTLWMRFRMQYEDATSKKWVDVAKNADSGFKPVPKGADQFGIDFQLVPTSGSFTLRGVVSFQWRKGAGVVVHAAERTTTGGHKSVLGADPKGFSAATCTIA